MPTLFGIGAWGLVVGVALINSGLTLPQALGMIVVTWGEPMGQVGGTNALKIVRVGEFD